VAGKVVFKKDLSNIICGAIVLIWFSPLKKASESSAAQITIFGG
jgi:hypothetical protein